MPCYEYNCEPCDFNFERVGQTDDSHSSCPQCGKHAGRVISQTTFHLKGKGWYATTKSDEKVLKTRAKRKAGVK